MMELLFAIHHYKWAKEGNRYFMLVVPKRWLELVKEQKTGQAV